MGADEEHLYHVGFLSAHGVDTIFEFGRLSRPLAPVHLMGGALTSDLAVFGNLGVCPLGFVTPAGAKGWDELDTAFVKSQSMAEVHNGIVRTRERQVFRNQSDRLHGVPAKM